AFRNEITPGNFIFRTREFEQMQMQFFVKPGTDLEWFEFWRAERMKWLLGLGLKAEKLRFHQHTKDELAHYAKDAYDIQYEFPFGWSTRRACRSSPAASSTASGSSSTRSTTMAARSAAATAARTRQARPSASPSTGSRRRMAR